MDWPATATETHPRQPPTLAQGLATRQPGPTRIGPQQLQEAFYRPVSTITYLYIGHIILATNMGDVYTIAGGKGGIGKTTTTINAGIALQENGLDTIVLDGDLGMTNLGTLMGIQSEPSIHDVLAGRASVNEATVEGPAGLSVLPGSDKLEAFAEASPSNLRPLVEELEGQYDAIVIDTAAGLCQETVVPMRIADYVVLVATDDDIALADARKMHELARHVDTDVLGAVVTRLQADAHVPDISDQLEATVLSAVPEDPEATKTEPLVVNAPDTEAAEAYRDLARKLERFAKAKS